MALPLIAALYWLCCALQPVSTDPRIVDIKATLKDIDSHLKELNRSRVILQTGTDRGGELTIYRRGSDIVRVDAIISGSNSDVQDMFYYSGGKIFFVRTKMITYPYSSTSNGFDFAAPRVKATADYYMRDGKLIPLGRLTIQPSTESRLSQEAELFLPAIRRGDQAIDIEKLLK